MHVIKKKTTHCSLWFTAVNKHTSELSKKDAPGKNHTAKKCTCPPSKICAIAVQNINPHDFPHSSFMYAKRDLQKQIWISQPPSPYCCPLMISQLYAHVQCCSPSPAYTAIMHTHTDTQQSWNWLKQRRSGAADSHNHTTWEKATDHVFMMCRGMNREICYPLIKTAAWRKHF